MAREQRILPTTRVKRHVHAVPGNVAQPAGTVAANVELAQNNEDPRRFLVKVNVTLSPNPDERANYRGEVSVSGFFRVDAEYRNDARQLAAVTGASILFNTIREMVANITARGPWPMVTLQPISFKDVKILDTPQRATSRQEAVTRRQMTGRK